MRWLRRFFYSDDPVVKVAAGLSEPEAGMLRELLESNGIAAAVKNVSYLSAYGAAGTNSHGMWVKRSDLERARELLAPLLRADQLGEGEGG